MQMYKGLPIITNKMPEHERNGIPHHLLDFIGLDETPWTVAQFVREGSRIIDEIRSRGKLPIVVGGTHYYTHALLFKEAILADENQGSRSDDDDKETAPEPGGEFAILSKPTEEILQKLREVDPDMAQRWHPRDRRKIQRSLEIWLKTGKRASEVYQQQQRKSMEKDQHQDSASDGVDPDNDDSSSTNGLRYPTLLLWLEAEDAALKRRLNDRVDSMVENGLVDEARSLAVLEADLTQKGVSVDKSKGIWVSIGYKEMQPCLEPDGREARATQQISAIDSVKAGTRRYAKRQNRYIRIRLTNALDAAGAKDRLFLLDCSDLDEWDSRVSQPAQRLVDSFLNGNQGLPDPKSLSGLANRMLSHLGTAADGAESRGVVRATRRCEVCDKTLMTEKEWQGHLASRGHKNTVASRRKRDLQTAQAQSAATSNAQD
jgi:tRNA dimethylallyltransferase